MANPTKKVGTIPKSLPTSLSAKELKTTQGKNGKRVPVQVDELENWLLERAERYGFKVDKASLEIVPCYINFSKDRPEHDRSHRLRSVLYRGILEVADPTKFQLALTKGMGPGKAFGFGLLSVYPVQSSTAR